MHQRNICHRDIKPENILYNQENGKIKIIDFDISKKTFLRGERRDMLTVIGTPYYLAPEVFVGGGYDERIDIWALGITLYRLVAGRTPFEHEYHS
jgi:calcium-dependent protein kinase